MKKILLTIVSLFFICQSYAQHKLDFSYSRFAQWHGRQFFFYTLDESNYQVVTSTHKEVALESYRKDNKLLARKKHKLNNIVQGDIIDSYSLGTKDFQYLFIATYDRKTKAVKLHACPIVEGQLQTSQVFFVYLHNKQIVSPKSFLQDKTLFLENKLSVSKDSTKVILNVSNAESLVKHRANSTIAIFNQNLDLIFDKQVEFDATNSTIKLLDFDTSKDGSKLFFLIHAPDSSEGFFKPLKHTLHIISKDEHEAIPIILDSTNHIQRAQFLLDKNSISILGTYSIKPLKANADGFFYYKLDLDSLKSSQYFDLFSDESLCFSALEIVANENMPDKIVHLAKLSNGHILMISSAVKTVSSSTGSNALHRLKFGNLILSTFNAEGKIIRTESIYRRFTSPTYTSILHKTPSSILIHELNGIFYIVYNSVFQKPNSVVKRKTFSSTSHIALIDSTGILNYSTVLNPEARKFIPLTKNYISNLGNTLIFGGSDKESTTTLNEQYYNFCHLKTE